MHPVQDDATEVPCPEVKQITKKSAVDFMYQSFAFEQGPKHFVSSWTLLLFSKYPHKSMYFDLLP